jgi:hypothetical protein
MIRRGPRLQRVSRMRSFTMTNSTRPVRLLARALLVAGVLTACGSESSGEPDRSASVEASSSAPATPTAATTPFAAATSIPNDALDGGVVAPYVGSLRFDWPTGCDVLVTETVERDGETAQLVYPLFIREAGNNVEVRYGELDVIHVRNQPVSAAEQEQLAALFAQPSFTVDREGAFVSVSGVDNLLRNMQTSGVIGEVPDRDAFVAAIEETVLNKYWGSWVGRWTERPQVTAEVMEDVIVAPVADTSIIYDFRRESLSPPEQGSAHLRDTTTIEGDELDRFVAANFGALSGGAVAEFVGEVDGEKVTVVEAVLDPVTLRPTSARFDDRSTIEIDGEIESSVEIREWEFDWSSPSCA